MGEIHYHNSNVMQTTFHTYPRPATFEKAREAVATIKALKPTLSPAELETLEILLDSEAMETIEKSIAEAAAGKFESLEDAVKE